MAAKNRKISKMSKKDKLSAVRDLIERNAEANSDWYADAHIAQKFKAGHQFTETEIMVLSTIQRRDIVQMNFCHSTVELIMGMFFQNPVRIFPDPVEPSDQFQCDVLEALVDWVDENQTNAEDEHNDAIENTIITGRGHVGLDIRLDPQNPEEIEILEHSIQPREIVPDPSLQGDASIGWRKWMPVADFQVRYPGHDKLIDEYLATSTTSVSNGDSVGQYAYTGLSDNENALTSMASTEYYDSTSDQVLVVVLEYYEHYNRYYGVNPQTGEIEEFDKKGLKALKAQIPNFDYTTIPDKKVKTVHFTRDTILYEGDSPLKYEGFSIVDCYGYQDKSKSTRYHYGIVKLMLDAQKVINKGWMQATNLMAKQGIGVMAESDAFDDVEQAQDSWSDPDAITVTTPGAISGNKIKEKTGLQFPAASMQMVQMAMDTLKHITGVNHDLMGNKQGNEPGVVVRLRQEQGKTIIARLFENFVKMKRELYKRKLSLIVTYMPDKQIEKILGEGERYLVQDGMIQDKKYGFSTSLRDWRNLDYNVSVEDAPGNLTKKMSELAIYMELLKSQFPVNPSSVIERLDLSAGDKADWITYIDQQKQQAQQMQQQQMQMQGQIEQAKMQLAQQETQIKAEKVKIDGRKVQTEMVVEEAKLRQKAEEAAMKDEASERDFMGDMYIEMAKLDQQDQQFAKTQIENLLGELNNGRNEKG
jgi:hypothetical protein